MMNKNLLRKTVQMIVLMVVIAVPVLGISPAAQAQRNRPARQRYITIVGDVTMSYSTMGKLRRLEVHADGETYKVYPEDDTRLKVSLHDTVRVRGQLEGERNIREARVAILDWADNPATSAGAPQSDRLFEGEVTEITSDERFDLRVDGKTYNVFPINGVPRALRTRQIVQVRGWRYGNNDIRDAYITILRR